MLACYDWFNHEQLYGERLYPAEKTPLNEKWSFEIGTPVTILSRMAHSSGKNAAPRTPTKLATNTFPRSNLSNNTL